MHKIFSSLPAAILALSLLTVPASAATFSDVPENSEYYAAVTYLSAPTRTDVDGVIHEGAVVSGTGDGLFSPDRAITIDEFTVMLMNTYYHEDWPCATVEGADWALGYTTTAWSIDIYTLDEYETMKADGVTRAEIWNMLANASKLTPYPAWLYTDETPSVDFARDIEYAMYDTGLYIEEVDANEIPTRGEIAQLIYRLETGDYEKQSANNFWGNVTVTMENNLCWQVRNTSMYEWTILPDKYKVAFAKNGWALQFVDNMWEYYPDHVLACGITDYSKKLITISRSFNLLQRPTLVHEFGHFVMGNSNLSLTAQYMYDTEQEALAKLIETTYCQTNQNEMFAEAFRYVLMNQDDEETYTEMAEKIPLSLAVIENGLLNAKGIVDYDAIDEAVRTNWDYICAANEDAA